MTPRGRPRKPVVQRIKMPALHTGQEEIRKHPARFKAEPIGRRWGKSHLAAVELNSTAIETGLPTWWIWPNHVVAREAWSGRNGLLDWGLQLQRQGMDLEISKTEKWLRYPGGGSVAIRSADNPDHLVAVGLGLAVFDEAGLHKVKTWEESVRPALADHRGRALFVGVPKGRQGLLWHAHQLGMDPTAEDWATFQRQTPDNPLFPKDEWAALEADHAAGRISDRYFRQEYLAEFLGDHGAVFENVAELATAPYIDARPPAAYVSVGIDWGRTNDATVFSAWNLGTVPVQQIALERIVGRSYEEQLRRLDEFCARWQPDILVPERNSMGGPLCEQLAAKYPTWIAPDGEPGFLTHPGTKRPLIERYAHAFRLRELRILPDPVQITEHQAYESRQLASGTMQYSAPKNDHDDTVMAGALAHSQTDDRSGDFGCIVL